MSKMKPHSDFFICKFGLVSSRNVEVEAVKFFSERKRKHFEEKSWKRKQTR